TGRTARSPRPSRITELQTPIAMPRSYEGIGVAFRISVTGQQGTLAEFGAAWDVGGRGPVSAVGLELQRLSVGGLLHRGPEAVVVDKLDRLDREFGGDATVGEAYEVVAVLLFAAGREVR